MKLNDKETEGKRTAMDAAERLVKSSDYLSTLLRCRADFVDWLWTKHKVHRRYPLTGLYQDLLQSTAEVNTFAQLLRCFREFKQRHFLRIGTRDLLGWADLAETTSQLSDLASVTLQTGLDALSAHPEWWAGGADEIKGWIQGRKSLSIIVLGLGKLGGDELNYVSDVDLIFLYAPAHEAKSVDSGVLVSCNRLIQWLMKLLSDRVEGDRVFEVDLRLRPGGKEGVLMPSLTAATSYYLSHGRPWERQMLLKARPVAGDRSMGTAFIQEIRPFVFRRFLDFQALDELKAMRNRILAEAVRPTSGWRQFDVKLGIGGIREVEFLIQSLQLIYGGRHPELDEPNTLRCLQKLRTLRLLPDRVVEELSEGYIFLRRVEHWVQLDQNRHTQKIPQSGEALAHLSFALGFEGDWDRFFQKLEAHCTTIHEHFLVLFQDKKDQPSEAHRASQDADDQSGASDLSRFPDSLIQRLRSHLNAFPEGLQSRVFKVLKSYGGIQDAGLRETVVLRLERYFGQVLRRPGLIKVFQTSGAWVERLCRGMVQSALSADLLLHHPSLVEGIATVGGACPDTASWQTASERLLERATGYEESLEWIRRLKNERLLQLTLGDLHEDLDHVTLEFELSALADLVIQHTYERVRDHLHLEAHLPLSILALGKLGSRELSYLSDLDLVFVYEPRSEEPEDQIPGEVIRLIQRFMRMLSTPLHEGPGYAVDPRLRPTGNFGPLIVTRNAWVHYYREQADLWEIQALLRLRAVAGNRELGSWIEDRAREICYQKREPAAVWRRLCHLRGRMERERGEEKGEVIDLKLGRGGLVDFEFLVQGHLLIEGSEHPGLRSPSVRAALDSVLEHTGEGSTVREMRTAFRVLRALEHRLRLHTNTAASRLSPELFDELRVLHLWPPGTESSSIESWEDILRLRRQVRSFFHHFCPDL